MSDLREKIDSTSFKTIFDTYYQRLCNYVFKLSGDSTLSEDIVQEVFIDIWNKRNVLNIQFIKNYLFKSCHNRFLEYVRKNKSSMIRTSLDVIKWETLYELQIEESEDLNDKRIKQLSEAIENLPPKCKEAFKLSKFENLKYKEIAEVMGISTKTVEIHLSKALAHLRSIIPLF